MLVLVTGASSGFGQEQAVRSSRKAGFHHHLVKPIDVDSLRSLLAQSVPLA